MKEVSDLKYRLENSENRLRELEHKSVQENGELQRAIAERAHLQDQAVKALREKEN